MTNYERIKNMSVEGAWIKVKSRTKQLDITKKVKDAVWHGMEAAAFYAETGRQCRMRITYRVPTAGWGLRKMW